MVPYDSSSVSDLLRNEHNWATSYRSADGCVGEVECYVVPVKWDLLEARFKRCRILMDGEVELFVGRLGNVCHCGHDENDEADRVPPSAYIVDIEAR